MWLLRLEQRKKKTKKLASCIKKTAKISDNKSWDLIHGQKKHFPVTYDQTPTEIFCYAETPE